MNYCPEGIEISNIAGGMMIPFTVTTPTGRLVLEMTPFQIQLINLRFQRQFYIRLKEERLVQMIDDAPTYRELEAVAEKYDLADICDFADINLYGIKRMLKVIVKVLYRYPKLRGRFCFLGTHSGYKKAVDRLLTGDVQVLKDFGLEYICSEDMARQLGGLVDSIVKPLLGSEESYIATAVTAFGFFDAILFDQNDYDGYAYIKMVALLRENEKCGFHPQGCASPESVVYHEVGHMLDKLCSLEMSTEFVNFIRRHSSDDIRRGISEYGATAPAEAIAEAFAEYMCNPSPRPMAKWIGEYMDRLYRSLR